MKVESGLSGLAFDRELRRVNLQWHAGEGDPEPDKVAEWLASDAGKEWFKTTAPTLGVMTPEEVEKAKEGVARKNAELLKEKKAVQDKLAEAEKRGESFGHLTRLLRDYEVVDAEGEIDYDGVEKSLSRLRRKGDGEPGELDELQRQLKRSQRDYEAVKKDVALRDTRIEEAQTMIQERDDVIADLLIDGAFRSALSTHGYSDLIVKNILPALRGTSKVQVEREEPEGEGAKPKYRAVCDDGRSVEDWVKLWKDTDEGKALRLAPANSGGGGSGSRGTGGASKAWGEMTPSERMKLFQDNPDLYRRKKKEAAG